MSRPARNASSRRAGLWNLANPLPPAAWLLLGLVAASLGWNGWTRNSMRELVQLAILLGGAVSIGRSLSTRQRGWFGSALAAAFCLNLALAVAQLLKPDALAPLLAVMHGAPGAGAWGPDLAEEICTGLWSSHRLYAAFMVIAFPFVPLAMRNRPAPLRRGISAALLLLTAQTIFHAGFLVILGAVCLLLLACLPDFSRPGRQLAMGLAILLVTISGLRLLGPRPAPDAFTPLHAFGVASDTEATPTRLTIERAAALRDLPCHLLGRGPGDYRNAIRRARIEAELPPPVENRVPRDSNSQLTVLAVESGPAATLAFALLTVSAFLAALRRVWSSTESEATQCASEAAALAGFCATALFTLTLSRSLGILTGTMIGIGLGTPGTLTAATRCIRLVGQGVAIALVACLAMFLRTTGWGTALPAGPALAASELLCAYDGDRAIPAFFIEAEAAEKLPANFAIQPSHDAGGTRILSIPANSGKQTGQATYLLDVPVAGRYKLWVRARWEGGCSNSVNCRAGTGAILTIEDGLFDRWHWVDVAETHMLSLPAGSTEFHLINSEDGVHIDQIAFVADRATVPVGILSDSPPGELLPSPDATDSTDNPLPFGDDLPQSDAFDKY